jgi:hypothetical protein
VGNQFDAGRLTDRKAAAPGVARAVPNTVMALMGPDLHPHHSTTAVDSSSLTATVTGLLALVNQCPADLRDGYCCEQER